jgi:TonB family protein
MTAAGRLAVPFAALTLDGAAWVVLALMVRAPPAAPEPIPLDLAVDAGNEAPAIAVRAPPRLPILDAPDLHGEQPPPRPSALAEHDFAPERQSRRRARSGAIVRARPAGSAVAETPGTAAAAPFREPLPLVEGSDDVPEDLPLGAVTRVATLASPLAAYLDEIRRAVRSRWHPSAVYRRVDPEGTNPVTSGHTIVRVAVRADGGLAELALDTPSGMPVLDQEAEAAFRRAAPFAPLPPGIGDPSGRLAFRFGLLLDLAAARFLGATAHDIRDAWRSQRGLGSRDQDRLIVTRLRLRSDGSLADATLEASAGAAGLDELALELVRGVGYPRPPASLVAGDGRATIRAAFVLRRAGADAVHVYRRPAAPGALLVGR